VAYRLPQARRAVGPLRPQQQAEEALRLMAVASARIVFDLLTNGNATDWRIVADNLRGCANG